MKLNISKAHIGQISWNKGKKLSIEHKLNLSLALKGRSAPNKGQRTTCATYKKCTKCGKIKPIDQYYYAKKIEVYVSRCKECRAETRRGYNKKNKEKVKQWKKNEYIRSSAFYKARASKNYQDNKKVTLSRIHNRYEKKKKEIITYIANWRKKNPDKISYYAHKRRLIIKHLFFKVTKKDLNRQLERQNFECFWCHVKLINPTIDHVLPVSKGGRHSIGNIVFACKSCNSRKNNKLVIQFLYDSGFFGSSKSSTDKTKLMAK